MSTTFRKRVDSPAEGLHFLNTDASVGFTYIPLAETPEVQHLRTAIERSNFSFSLQGVFRETQIQEWDEIERENGLALNNILFEFKKNASPYYHLELKDGLQFQSVTTGNKFTLDSVSEDLALSRVLFQSNEGRLSLPFSHQDDFSDITMNVYLSGKGMTYYSPDNLGHRAKPPVLTMHRGLDHKLAQKNPQLAVRHTGLDHKGLMRANFILTMMPRNVVEAMPCLLDQAAMQPDYF